MFSYTYRLPSRLVAEAMSVLPARTTQSSQ